MMEHRNVSGERAKSRLFSATRWSLVLTAGGGQSPEAQKVMEELCHAYWYPLNAHIRGRGRGPDVLSGHLNAVHSVMFSGDSTRLITLCSNAESAKFRDLETGREVLTLPGPPTLLYFSGVYARGEVLAASRKQIGGPWHAWHAPSLEAIARAEAVETW
jgi:hypothetical protein